MRDRIALGLTIVLAALTLTGWGGRALAEVAVAGFTPGSFEVTPAGAASYTIPIQVPPGVAGMEPKLALAYSSQAGNGPIGVGWSLSGLSGITRCPRTLAQDGVRGSVNFDANDRFCLDGERLMLIAGTYGADGAEYRTERESFAKVVSYGTAGSGPAWFKVWTKAGQIMEYGNTADSRIEAAGKPIARVWVVNKIADTKGNYLTVTYTEDNANGDYSPSRIDYTGNTGTGAAPFNSVQFVYETRPDTISTYYVVAPIKNTVRLTTIKTVAGSTAVWEYRLAYQLGPTTQRSRATSVTQCNASGCLLPVALTWDTVTPAVSNSTWTGGHGIGDKGWQIANLFGDGRQVYYTHSANGTHYATRLNKDGTVQNWTWSGGHGVADAGWQLADLFGDGRQVYYTHGNDGKHYATRLNADGTLQNFTWSGGSGVSDGGWQMADLFGEGRQVYYTNTSNGRHYATRLNPDGTLQNFTWSSGTTPGDQGWQLADLFGDGRQMYYSRGSNGEHRATRLNADGSLENWLWPAGGGIGDSGWQVADLFGDGRQVYYSHGKDGKHYATRLNSDSTWQNWTWSGGHGVADAGWQLADLFGDGRQVYYTHASNGTHYATRLNADGTLQNWTWSGGSGVGDGGWQMADLFGDGRALYYTHGANGTHSATSFVSGGVDRVSAIAQGSGAVVSITQAPLTDPAVYTKETNVAYPTFALQTPLNVVARVSGSDGIGGTVTTQYSYGGLKAESGTGRGPLGFRWVKAKNLATGIEVYTEYRQDWPYVSLPSLVKKSLAGSGSGGVLAQSEITYACLNPAGGASCMVAAGNRYLPYASQTLEKSWDLNGAALPVVTTASQYDRYGNAVNVAVSTSDGFSKTTVSQYVNDDANWILGRLKRSATTASTTSAPDTVGAPPSITLSSNGTSFTAPGSVTLSASATASTGRGVGSVEFYNGTTLLATKLASPYSFTWSNVGAGTYTLTAKAYDNQGATATSAPVTVSVTVPPPTVNLASNVSSVQAPGNITLTANAGAASGRTVGKVEFYKGATLIATDTAWPYSATLSNVAAGSYTFTAKVYDSAGATSVSGPVTVNVTAPAVIPPTATLTIPTGTAYKARATITASVVARAASGRTMSRVDFYRNGQLIDRVTGTAGTYNSTMGVDVGTYVYAAKAYDSMGAFTTTPSITVTVTR
jgi:hypothetical protein